MSSVVHAYNNNAYVASGKQVGNQFVQTLPKEKVFASETEWRASIQESNQPVFQCERSKVDVNETVATTDSNSWTCGYCSLPPGNDHRNCISRGYDYSLKAWEEARIFPKKEKTSSPTAPSSFSTNPNDWTWKEKSKAILPVGTYYIGDLCYALDDDLYENVFGPSYDAGLFISNLNPTHVFMMESTGGDGFFNGSDGKEYPVDSGTIGIASQAVLTKKKTRFTEYGSLYTFKSPVHVNLQFDNKFIFRGEDISDPQLTIKIYSDEDEPYEDSR